MNDSPDEPLDTQALPDMYVSPLRSVATEMHELFGELKYAGFSQEIAAIIIGSMLSNALGNRMDEEDDDDDDDDMTMEEDDEDDDEWDG